MAGCRSEALETRYGASTGSAGRDSINGFAGLRQLYEHAGWRTRTLNRFNSRAGRLEAIVWVPATPTAISPEATEWLEDWLRQGDKTLVFVTYDGVSDAAYWRRAAPAAAPPQRLEYRRRWAAAAFAEFQQELRMPTPASNGWWRWRRLPQTSPVAAEQIVAGSSSGAHDKHSRTPTDKVDPRPAASQPSLRLRFGLRPAPDPKSAEAETDGGLNGGSGPQGSGAAQGNPAGGVIPPWQQAAVEAAGDSSAEVLFQPQLSVQGGPPLLARVRSPEWGDSRILVVAGGTLIDNFALSTKPGRRIASQLVADSGTAGQLGFLRTEGGVFVDNRDEAAGARNGMELLVVWPLSLITMHAALLGLIVLLILMPIFGRPRRLARPSPSDFADHLDAVASWMQRSSDESYARRKISEYMRRVRGETSGPWILPEPGESERQASEAISGQHRVSAEPEPPLQEPPPQQGE